MFEFSCLHKGKRCSSFRNADTLRALRGSNRTWFMEESQPSSVSCPTESPGMGRGAIYGSPSANAPRFRWLISELERYTSTACRMRLSSATMRIHSGWCSWTPQPSRSLVLRFYHRRGGDRDPRSAAKSPRGGCGSTRQPFRPGASSAPTPAGRRAHTGKPPRSGGSAVLRLSPDIGEACWARA